MADEIKAGDNATVTLLVEHVDGDEITCSWSDGRQRHRGVFLSHTLAKVASVPRPTTKPKALPKGMKFIKLRPGGAV